MAEVMTSKADRDLMMHALGEPKRGEAGRRNYYCAEVESGDADRIRRLASMGLMTTGPTINDGRDFYAYVTAEGAAELGVRLPPKR